MHLFSTAILARHQYKLLFVIIWLHVSVLDLFYITYQGPVFLWQENAQLLTLVVHFSIAMITVGCYWLINRISSSYLNKLN